MTSKRPKPPWCGECDETTRMTLDDPPGRCATCHPLGKRAMSADPAAAPLIFDGLIDLSTVQERRVSWRWPGYLPAGHLVMIDGDPGVGKSTLCLDFAARVTAGAPWPDGQPCEQGNVLILTAEEALSETVLPRLLLAGGDPSRVYVLDHIPNADGIPRLPALPYDIPYIHQVIVQRKIKLVIVDVLASYLGGGEVNSHTDTDVRRALFPLFRMAQSTRATVMMLRHLNKSDSKNAMYRGGGSIGIIGQARAGYLVAEDPESYEDRRLFACIKNNLAPKPKTLAYTLLYDEVSGCASVQWHGEDAHTAAELLGVTLDPEQAEEQDHVVSWLQDYLFHCGGEAGAGQVIGAAVRSGYAKATLQRARKRAGISYKRAGWQKGTLWVLDPAKVNEMRAASPPAETPPAKPGALPRAACPSCGRSVALRRNGMLREHQVADSASICPMSGRMPDLHPPHPPHSPHPPGSDADGASSASLPGTEADEADEADGASAPNQHKELTHA